MFDKEEEKAKKLDQGGIRLLWQDIKEGKALDWEAGRALEYLIIRAWQLDAAADTEIRSVSWPFVVTYPQKIGPVEQIDGAVFFTFSNFLIEAKDYPEAVDVEP